jgi:hypothetical protein
MQKSLFRYWIALWLAATVLFWYPINTFLLRMVFLASMLGVWAGCFYFGRRKKFFCVGLLLVTLLAAGFLSCPGRDFDRKQLRDGYVHALRGYAGTKYIWGGENSLGIDCSGLVRAGLIKANFQAGLRTLNPQLMRFALSLWWRDASAEALGQEYRHQTKFLLPATNLNELDSSKIRPGDIAVTVSGVHVMAFLGDRQWIEADPDIGKVVIVQVPERTNSWFQETFKILRWRELVSE